MTTASIYDLLIGSRAQRRNPRDSMGTAFVLLAMTLVTLALGLGLHLQLGFTAWAAAVVALSIYVALVSGHVSIQHAETVAELRGEIGRLESELTVLKRETATMAADEPTSPVHRAHAGPPTAPNGQQPAREKVASVHAAFCASSTSPHATPAGARPLSRLQARDEDPAAAREIEPAAPDRLQPPAAAAVVPKNTEAVQVCSDDAAPNLLVPPAPNPAAVSDADFVHIHGVIKKLAEELSAAKSAPAPETGAPVVHSAAQGVAAMPAVETPAGAADPREINTIAADVQAWRAPPSVAPAHAQLVEISGAIAAARLDVYLEPILGLSDLRARHYEVSVRLRTQAGASMTTEEFSPVARGTGLLPLIDAMRVSRSSRIAGRLSDRGAIGSLFSQISGESLASNRFLQELADAYHSSEAIAERLVLSFAQNDVRGFASSQWASLKEFADLGFRFALDDVLDLDMDFETLTAAGFAFATFDARVLLEGLPAADSVILAADLCRHVAGLDLTLIVGRIDDEAQLASVLGFGALFGQGTLFGAPRAVKAELLRHPQDVAA